MSAARRRMLAAGFLFYQYGPLPARWKDVLVRLAYRLAGPLFEGERNYELWRRRAAAPAASVRPTPAGSRRQVLVIDRYVPQPDRDAGSRSMWCVMRALLDMGLAVKFWPRDLLYDPEYVPWLERIGIQVFWGEPLEGRFAQWYREHGAEFDYVLLSRPMVAREFVPVVRAHSRAKVLFYGHDLHHARLLREYELNRSSALRWEAAILRKVESQAWRAADVVYYPSSEEAGVVERECPGKAVQTLPLYFFDDDPAAAPRGPAARAGLLFVAGFGHAPNVEAATWLVEDILPRVLMVRPDTHLWLVGSNPGAQVRALAGTHVTVTGYVPDEVLLSFYGSARVAIVPLRAGAGMKGKVIEALHHGLPLVTTSTGAQGLDGLMQIVPVCDDAAEIAASVVALLQDDTLWMRVSSASREYSRQRFSREAMVQVLARDVQPGPLRDR